MRVLFDLDGTLTDSRPGIARCFQHALTELGRVPPPEAELSGFVGPPLAICFERLLGSSSPPLIERAVAAYRERYEQSGMFENALYPDVRETLDALSAANHQLDVVTSKPAVYARRILRHFGIDGAFAGVYGPELTDRRFDKGLLIRAALQSVSAGVPVMVGDRADDIAGARQNNLASIGVTWGYGSREELEAAGPDRIVESMAELLLHLERAV